jgi:formamidopyrimidine-DNA glycosylase
MPELPEVEVVKKSLEKTIINLSITNIKINNVNLRYKVKKEEIKQTLGLKILKIKRRSKYLIFFFNKDLVMIVHLGMTGKFLIDKNKIKRKTSFYYDLHKNNNKHNHIIFTFKNNLKLIYNDVRRFGFIKFEKKITFKKNFHLKMLGPEPLHKLFNFKYFKNYIKGKNKPVKGLLMDQKFVSGLGNIYVNEILYSSNIMPDRKISKINDQEIKKIIISTKNILNKAIVLGGSTIKDFLNSTGKTGSFQQHFSVYGKNDQKCSNPDCNTKIKKITLSGRASFFCPNCQK